MAVRTVTVNLKLDATAYVAIARSVVNANRGVERSMTDLAMAANAASIQTERMSRDMRQMSNRARLAERRVRELREEIDRLIAAQAALNQGGPIPPVIGGATQGSRGMLGMLVSPMGVAIATAIAAAAPLIGAALSGVILTVLGGGALAVGIAAAVNDEKVKRAWGQFGEFLVEEFRTYGQAFDVPLIAAADRFHDRFATISPKIRSTLAEMSKAVLPLTEGLIGFIESAGPGVKEGLMASLKVLAAFASELPELGRDVGDFFKLLAGGAEGAADGVALLMDVLGATLQILGTYLGMYSMLYGQMVDLPDMVKALGGLSFVGLTDGATQSVLMPLQKIGYQADETASALERLTRNLLSLTSAFNDQWGAAIAYEAALDDLAESFQKNGRSMDISTEKGRANNEALKTAFERAEQVYQANIKAGMSAEQAAAQYNAQIEAARKVAIANGAAAAQVNALADAQRKLPTGERSLTYTVYYRTVFQTQGAPTTRRVPGVQIAQRDGGIVAARDGLMMGAGIFTGGRPIVKFAETGTGHEAYIAQNAPAGRSLAIANTAAGWHGGQVVPKGAMGNMTVVNLNVTAGMGTNGRDVGEQILDAIQPVINRRGGKVQFAVMGRE